MRDLELRGAGKVLGEAGIGYELYVKKLTRQLKIKRRKITERREEIAIEVDTSARIPAEYIKDETLNCRHMLFCSD